MKRSLLFPILLTFAACSSVSDPVAPASERSGDKITTKVIGGYVETRLVADIPALNAAIVDPNLVNAWGLAFGSTGILWVANNHTGTSTLYNAAGAKQGLTVTVPGVGDPGVPTGLVFNPTSNFVIPGSTSAKFIFAGEDGTITAWSGGTNAVIVADRSPFESVYKGIAMSQSHDVKYLYLTDFRNRRIDVFNPSWQFVKSFTDPAIPGEYAPFGIHNINGKLYVTFAKQLLPDKEDDDPGVGRGFVDVFNPDGSLVRRFATRGTLNSPWAVVLAPAGFGPFSGDILVGNFGDGFIGAYDPGTGNFLGLLKATDGSTLSINGLWDLTFGPGTSSTTLYFSAGPDHESHGLLGTLTPAN
jgi:uncharacterized protein (TIGR03118 family)